MEVKKKVLRKVKKSYTAPFMTPPPEISVERAENHLRLVFLKRFLVLESRKTLIWNENKMHNCSQQRWKTTQKRNYRRLYLNSWTEHRRYDCDDLENQHLFILKALEIWQRELISSSSRAAAFTKSFSFYKSWYRPNMKQEQERVFLRASHNVFRKILLQAIVNLDVFNTTTYR